MLVRQSCRLFLEQFQREQNYGLAPGRVGLSEEDIESIPVREVSHEDGAEACAICLSNLQPNDVFRHIPCRHRFHKACLDRWLTLKDTCPLCVGHVAGVSSSLLV